MIKNVLRSKYEWQVKRQILQAFQVLQMQKFLYKDFASLFPCDVLMTFHLRSLTI